MPPYPETSGYIIETLLNLQDWYGDGKFLQAASKIGDWEISIHLEHGGFVTFNGEIYNHLDLRKLLGLDWRGHSDTETLVECLAARGLEGTLPRLNGMFAFGALDLSAGKLYLVRDPFGVKPVYYSVAHDGSLAFSSELRSLFALDRRGPSR